MMKRFESTAENEPGRAQFERIHAQYPLKFIPTQGHAAHLAVVYMLSYGGGIISGDTFNIDLTVQTTAILLLMTQGNTKVFKDRLHQRLWQASLDSLRPTIRFSSVSEDATQPRPSVQIIRSRIATDATLLVLPDPVTCFRSASFQSRQTFELESATSQLVLLDWFTSGRVTRGEHWCFRHYSSRIDLWLGRKLVLKDAMVLDDEPYLREAGEETAYAARLKPYLCFATLVIVASAGDSALMRSVEAIQRKSEEMRLMPLAFKSRRDRDLLWSVSPFLDGRAALVRVAGMTTELVRDFVKHQCLGQGLQEIVGEGMFNKILM
ncbi:MAG: urease accessory protein UreD [Benjaminiella poitrasii]|nr:MAG: urease accessory protein UreD [Benjaminiella poitrasii]